MCAAVHDDKALMWAYCLTMLSGSGGDVGADWWINITDINKLACEEVGLWREVTMVLKYIF